MSLLFSPLPLEMCTIQEETCFKNKKDLCVTSKMRLKYFIGAQEDNIKGKTLKTLAVYE
jgi:hypothetical protein